jgi:thiol-disulfide isomerase/thioredoxin
VSATAAFHPWPRPRNTDPTWFAHYTGQEDRYKSTRALALEAQGWALCQSGRCGEGEPLLRQAVELRRSEGNLTHLAKTLEKLGRATESADARAQAESEWLESLKRRLKKTPSKDFEVAALDSRPMRLSTLQGKVVLVNFWATWCTPCTQEMPVLEELYRKYRERGLEILAVSVDEEASRYKVERFVKEQALSFPVLYDSGAASLYGVNVYPTSLLIDRKGLVRLRFNLLERRSFEAILDQLLKGEL